MTIRRQRPKYGDLLAVTCDDYSFSQLCSIYEFTESLSSLTDIDRFHEPSPLRTH